MNDERILKVGIVGLGLAARAHLAGYLFHPNSRLVAVCDVNPDNARQFIDEYKLEVECLSYEDMLSADIDLIDLCTPVYLHSNMVQKAASAGKHIHCEKPFCCSIDEGRKASQSVSSAGVKLLVGETYVFLTSHVKARELIEAGEIGRPMQIRQRFGNWLLKEEHKSNAQHRDDGWRIDPMKSGGGKFPWIFDHAVHLFSAAEYLMLDVPIREVYAITATTAGISNKHPLEYGAYQVPEIDIPIITWKYEDTDLQGLWARAEALNGKYDYMTGFSSLIIGERGAIEVLGEGGANLFLDGKQQHLLLYREGKETVGLRFDEGGDAVWESEINYYPQGHINQVYHLIDSILQNKTPRYSCEQGIHAVQCTLAVIRSAQAGIPVKLDEILPEYTAY